MIKHEELVSALQTHFGFDTFKGEQEAIIRNVIEGNDTFVLMPTGGGKSLCYQLPSLIMDGVGKPNKYLTLNLLLSYRLKELAAE